MHRAVIEAQEYLKLKFGEHPIEGTYAVPTETSKGQAYMKVVFKDGFISDFTL